MSTYEDLRQTFTSRIQSVDDDILTEVITQLDVSAPHAPDTGTYVVRREAGIEYSRRARQRARDLDDEALINEISATVGTDLIRSVDRYDHEARMDVLFQRRPAAEQAHDAYLDTITDWDDPTLDHWAHVRAALNSTGGTS